MRNMKVSRFPTLGFLAVMGLLIVAALVVGCGGSNSLRGEITLQESDVESATPVARVVVRLLDTSLADAPSITIAEAVYTDDTGFPLDYELEWDVELEDRSEYSVGARFYDSAGSLIYINDTVFTVEPGDRRANFYVIRV